METKIYRYGYISLSKPAEKLLHPVAVAIVSLAGENYERYNLDDLFTEKYNAELIAVSCLKYNVLWYGINKKQVSFLEKDWQIETDRVFLASKQRRGNIPVLYTYERDKDPLIRQQAILTELERDNSLSIADSITEENKQEIKVLGSLQADALTGSIMIAQEERKSILSKLQRKPVAFDWRGLTRITRTPANNNDPNESKA